MSGDLHNQECPNPDCMGRTSFSIYEDGHGYCHKCTHFVPSVDGAEITKERKSMNNEMLPGGEYIALPNRGLDKDVCEKFGVKVLEGDRVVFPYHDENGDYVAQKVRIPGVADKGLWKGAASEAKGFFGQHLWKGGKILLVTEGEYDALAAFQMFGKKYPVVSLRSGVDAKGAKAYNEFQQNFEYLRNFQQIVLCFDNDEPGIASARKIAENMLWGKIKVMSLSKFKDANEYLLNKAVGQFEKEFWDARPYLPQDIVYGTELRDRIIKKLHDRKTKSKVKYPWEGVNKLTYGIRTGEMVTLISGTGVGKSATIGELMHHLLTQTEEKIGLFMLEEAVEMANLRLASINAGKPFHLPDTEWTEDEIIMHLAQTVELRDADGNPRVVSFDHFGSNGVDELLFRVDHMVALGCKYIFLDHISIVVSDQSHGDERRALDEIATKLRTKCQEHDIALFVVSHLRRTNSKPHEEGGQTSLADIRGTQAIAQLSDIVIGLERDGQNEDEIERNTTRIRILKNRLSGLTGLASALYYDRDTGRLTEIKERKPEDDGSSTKSTTGSDSSSSSGDPSIGATVNPSGSMASNTVKTFNWKEGDKLPPEFSEDLPPWDHPSSETTGWEEDEEIFNKVA